MSFLSEDVLLLKKNEEYLFQARTYHFTILVNRHSFWLFPNPLAVLQIHEYMINSYRQSFTRKYIL